MTAASGVFCLLIFLQPAPVQRVTRARAADNEQARKRREGERNKHDTNTNKQGTATSPNGEPGGELVQSALDVESELLSGVHTFNVVSDREKTHGGVTGQLSIAQQMLPYLHVNYFTLRSGRNKSRKSGFMQSNH